MKRVVGYIRVSTEDQAGEDRYGLEAQREAIEKHCRDTNLELITVYQDTISGALAERPGLMALLEATNEGKFSAVVLPKLDRLSRDTMYCLWIEKELRKLDIELVSIAEPFRWDDPMQKLMLTMMAAFAEFEKELIKARMSGGRKAKARKGGYSGGGAAIGYKAKRGAKALILDKDKAGTIRRVFELRRERPELS